MGKIRSPKRFSDHFGVKPAQLAKVGALNVTLSADTLLFIDPLLLATSAQSEISKGATKRYEKHFEEVIKLLTYSKNQNDVAWRAAEKKLSFPEVKWTCLGYGGDSVSGSGSGAFTRSTVLETARQIVSMGVDDPDLFVSLALLEDGIGPDRISDMVTNIILPDLLSYNQRILKKLSVPTVSFRLRLRNGFDATCRLPSNPFLKNEPVVLVPLDILRDLPIASDWSEVATAAQHNISLRSKVNDQIANIWKAKTKKDKDQIRRWALSSRKSFNLFLEMLRGANPKAYDFLSDPLGKMIWSRIANEIAIREPFTIKAKKSQTLKSLEEVVRQIVSQFRFLIEERGLWQELYHLSKPRPESSAQHLFFAVAYAYCLANNIDVTPEADTGSGVVDFKFSKGMDKRVLVETKLSRNVRLAHGYEKQIERYKTSEQTMSAFYLVIDVGGPAGWQKKLLDSKNAAATRGDMLSEIEFVDGLPKRSASKS